MLTERKTGISTKFNDLCAETFFRYSEAGITAFEISVELLQHDMLDLPSISRWARDEGVDTWSYHLPFYPFEVLNPASSDKSVRDHTVEYFSALISRAAQNGFKYAVIHPSGEPVEAEERNTALEYSRETLFALAEVSRKNGIILAVEDLPRTCLGNCSREIRYLTDIHPELKVCFDVNHLLFESHGDFIKAVGDRIATVHISDYDFINERHWLPGEGKIDWIKLISDLDNAGYDGVFMYEVPKSAKNIIRLSPLTPADYAKNHESLKRGIIPPPLGKPNI